jgi:hypothetical protein
VIIRTTSRLQKEVLLTHDAAQSAVAEAASKGFAQGGESGLLKAELSEQKKLYEQGKLSPYFVAQTDAQLGDTHEALKYLTIGLHSHDEYMLNLAVTRVSPAFTAIRPSSNCSPKLVYRQSTDPQRKTRAPTYPAARSGIIALIS